VHLLEQIRAHARLCPNRVAQRSAGREVTYAELVTGMDAAAALVSTELADDRSPVAVLGHKEPEMLMAFLGSACAGHPYIPLDTSLPTPRIEQILANSGAKLVLTPQRVQQSVELSSRADLSLERAVKAEDAYYIIFTSGSTGTPKGVVITLHSLTGFIDWMQREHGFQPGGETFLNQAPFSFDLSVMDTYSSLTTGGTLVSLTAREIETPRLLFETLRSSGMTTWVSTPSFASWCLAERGCDAHMLPRLRRFLFCGETLPMALAGQLFERFPSAAVWNTYGPTETTVATTSVRIEASMLLHYAALPVGAPRPGTRILLLDASGEYLTGAGARGEIVIAGPNVSTGYLNRADLTSGHFFDLDGQRAYRTGDLGHFEDGLLFFDGRVDDQIKLNGYRIELGDVESNIRALPEVHDAIVVPVERDGRVESLVAFVATDAVTADETEFQTSQRLRRALFERLPAYMVPRTLRRVERWPLTANGKVDRRALTRCLQ
jgi:D-alanine--poly(phosphoribitol) ligase subunit 1